MKKPLIFMLACLIGWLVIGFLLVTEPWNNQPPESEKLKSLGESKDFGTMSDPLLREPTEFEKNGKGVRTLNPLE